MSSYLAPVDPGFDPATPPEPLDVHLQAAAAVADLPIPIPDGLDRLVGRLARTERDEVWSALVTSCAELLRRAPRLDRLHHLCSWTLAADRRLRRLAAAVLAEGDVLQVGAASILDFLARDPDATVRAEAASTRHRRMR